ncbi:MAG: TlpA family protein disulfide reductase [Candidatus Methylomirabilaceae bacterium]
MSRRRVPSHRAWLLSSKRPWLIVASTAVAVALLGVVIASSRSGPTTAARSKAQTSGFAYTAWEGGSATTASFAGKPLVVNFWASWCTSCLAEIPRFVEVYERHRPEVQFLGLNLQDNPDSAERLAKELGITYVLGRDPQGEAFQAFGGIAMPTTVLIDANGGVVKRLDGEVTAEQLESALVRLLEGNA